MAIQSNRRKRKHEAAVEDQQDDAEIAVPKKVPKESHTPKKKTKVSKANAGLHDENIDQVNTDQKDEVEEVEKESQVETASPSKKRKPRHPPKVSTEDGKTEDADVSPDSGIEPEEKPQRFPNDFKMMHFRSKLLGNNFITELRHFLYMCQTRPKIVAKYIEKRGKPLELAEAFNRIDKTNILHVGYLCEALQRIIMEILTNQKSHMESAAHAGRYFLKAHGSLLDQLLQSAQPSHRRNALKLLTAIVCVDPQLGRQVLSSYDILSNVRTMEDMLSHSKNDYKNDETVRKAYIHFILAFLVDGNTLLIRNILDRSHLIRVLAKGLVYDDHVTVCVVLNTLRQYVLENASILKTKKVHVFDLECCKHFSRLYDWEGPQGLANKYTGRKDIVDNNYEPENRESVASAVHQFLLILMTSRKHGISFDAMTNYRQKHNKLQGKLMGSLYRPFADNLKVELILKTLQACPDLGRHSARNFSNFVNPMRMSATDLPKGIDMLSKVIEAVPPSSLSIAMDKMTLTDFGFWIKELCLPVEALLFIVRKNLLKSDDFTVRLAINRLLLSMMTQYSNYVNAVAHREQSKRAGNSLRRFKFELLNHLLVNFPPIESILYSLYKSIQDRLEAGVNVLEHLSVTLELVLMMCKENRAFVNQTSQILDYLDVLRPLYETNFDEPLDPSNPDQMDKVQKIKLELKSIKTILLLFPRALHPQEKLFEKVLRSFVKAYMLDDVVVKTEAGELLHCLFHNTGMFDSSSYEIDIWLEALIGFDAETVDNVTSILLTILSLELSEVKELPLLNAAETATNVDNLRKLFAQIEQGQTVQGYVETLTLSKMMPLLLQGVTLEPPYDAYVELVCVLLYQYHTKPEQVQHLYSSKLEQHTVYMQKWQELKPTQLPASIAQHWPQLNTLQRTILKDPSQSFEEIFKPSPEDSENFELQLEENNLMKLHASLRNPRRNMIYAHNLLFLLSQLVESKQLNAEQSQLIADSLIKLLQIATQLDGNKIVIELTNDEKQQEQETHTDRLLHYIYGMRLSQLRATQLLSETSETQLHYVTFLRRLTEHCRTLSQFASYTSFYRLQLVIGLEIALDASSTATTTAGESVEQLMECVALVDTFELNAKECSKMLHLLTGKLQAGDYFMAANKTNHYYELMLRLLRRLGKLQDPVDCSECMLKLQGYYKDFCDMALTEQLEQLETAMLQFLTSQHHHLGTCDAEFFSCFFSTSNRKLSKAAVNLACLLLQRNGKLAQTFAGMLPEHLEQKELIYPLLDVAFKSGYQLEQSLLQRCYQTYKNGILKSIEKPLKAAVIYRDHAEASAALIAHCMPKSECLDYCQKQLKFDAVELFQMRVLSEIYKQAFASSKDAKQKENIFVNYVNLNVQMLALDLKKQSVQVDKLEQLAFNCYNWWQLSSLQDQLDQLDWSRLLKAPHWLNYCRSCLKQAMHMSEAENRGEQHQTLEQDHINGLLLKLLAYLCDRLYTDYSEEQEKQQGEAEDAALLYEMVCTHSCCYDHLLGEHSAVKTHLLQLLETLARKAPSALHSAHIPVILGAYHAKLSSSDRYALALLEHYERYDVGLAQYRPFIWGESAVAHYALRAADEDERAKLQQQETNVAQVLALIVRPGCQYTIENFPIWRTLHASKQLPELQFVNPSSRSQSFGDNFLEQRIEEGVTEFAQDIRRLCPKREEVYEQCYDPAFMLPLMMHCFAPESVVRAQWPVQNGLLGLSFCALSSLDKDMRLAAACCQQRYRTHFELSKFYEKALWTQAYDNIQGGLSELRTSWLAQRRTHGGTPRVPLIPALFIANSFNLSTDPTHLLYKRVMMYLQLKQSFNFQTIPEFNVFFYSQEPEHQQYREFIVQLLSNGIKCSADLFLLVSTNTFKVLLSFYSSNLANLDTNLLLLSVLSTCVKIPGAVKIMLEYVGILSWLVGIIRDTQFHQFDIIEGIISIVNNLFYAVAASRSELSDYAHIQLRLQRLVLQLLPMMSPRVSIPGLARLLNVLQKTASNNGQFLALSAQQLDLLLDCVARHWPDQIASVRYLRTFGGNYACPRSEYCDWLAKEQKLDTHSVLALSSLREYVIGWWQAHNLNANAKDLKMEVLTTSS